MHGTLQVIYPSETRDVLWYKIPRCDRKTYDAAMRQAMSVARWAHMFDAAGPMRRAESFLSEHMRDMVTVRAHVLSISTHTDTA